VYAAGMGCRVHLWQHRTSPGTLDGDCGDFWVRPVSPSVSRSGNVVAAALAESLGKPFPWTVGFFFGDLELSMDLWTTIAGISGFGGRVGTVVLLKA